MKRPRLTTTPSRLIATEWSNAADIELEPMPRKRRLEPLPEPPCEITMLGTILAASTRLVML